MQLSNRITHITGGGSDGWDVFYKARRMVGEGQPVIELTIGEHDIRTDPVILSAMDKAAKGGHTGYAMVPGIQSLRENVAKRIEERTGVETTFENIMITPGGQAALFAAHLAVCDEGETALYLDPYYATYPGTIRGIGAVATAVQTHAEDAFQPRAEDIAAKAKGAASLLINTPNNPTGTVYSRETLEGIAQVCKDHDLWLISDEVYDTQVWEGTHLSPRALPDMAERTLVVGSMSKSHAMTGSRVGWICGPKDAIENLVNLATHTTYGVAGFIQDAADFALNQGQDLEDKIAEPFRRRRLIAKDILDGQNTVGLIPAQGAMYIMLDIRATGLSGEDFANRLLDEHLIAVMPGESFGQSAAGHVRVAMTVDDESFARALTQLCEFAAKIA
ncbi:pyridoxal phosphate-dependent aminotransferase [Shimia thalassica]|uniref:pyridoxal phosphate-dependent aminotransferase n=1 Tax=Shimia thalassica TaxID=1715693 RepID=UPI000C072D7B|nr:pyridoxal phosphate-dependent aminotransferase [Shimia thalassica]MBU2941683.1 pyridoxal phosphate-dependent aminotransferase [Shimia thalassica]MDO6503936.1 pyridoxal phosphate-dependent aminotransferase [Shimia thalassica]MDP2495197.1 pyridoxal phosphate-dependent aminotransferase [Shimia thalassica]PHO03847.1 aspartate aminotransferase [Rhodobacteraceae bacterium 4F10]